MCAGGIASAVRRSFVGVGGDGKVFAMRCRLKQERRGVVPFSAATV